MTNVTLATQGDLFCIPCGDGYTSLGFDVCIERTRKLVEWLERPNLAPIAERGTLESYAEYVLALSIARNHCQETGTRCDIELSPQLKGLEGHRVEVVDLYGETRRFKVGRSTGWLPCHLEMANRRSMGGGAADRSYKSVRTV